jgi:hypothetical protein
MNANQTDQINVDALSIEERLRMVRRELSSFESLTYQDGKSTSYFGVWFEEPMKYARPNSRFSIPKGYDVVSCVANIRSRWESENQSLTRHLAARETLLARLGQEENQESAGELGQQVNAVSREIAEGQKQVAKYASLMVKGEQFDKQNLAKTADYFSVQRSQQAIRFCAVFNENMSALHQEEVRLQLARGYEGVFRLHVKIYGRIDGGEFLEADAGNFIRQIIREAIVYGSQPEEIKKAFEEEKWFIPDIAEEMDPNYPTEFRTKHSEYEPLRSTFLQTLFADAQTSLQRDNSWANQNRVMGILNVVAQYATVDATARIRGTIERRIKARELVESPYGSSDDKFGNEKVNILEMDRRWKAGVFNEVVQQHEEVPDDEKKVEHRFTVVYHAPVKMFGGDISPKTD